MQKKTEVSRTGNRRLVDTLGLMEYLSSGRANAVRFGTEAKARVQIGRSVYWDLSKIDRLIDLASE